MNEYLSAAAEYGWHPWPFFWIFPVLFWLAAITFAVRFRRGCGRDSGVGLLRSAFARGEISEEDYLSRLAVLRRSRRLF
ncbi:hypothetical protein ACFYTQ_29610 [Nocardia sp. NPDC004068]|uniref:hypothetical protein n=1 Tax=Nocardia sp. NPDC004068 TaxID=3364303 RepID=UPI00368B10E1